MLMLRIESKPYGNDYFWGDKWLFVSAPNYIGAKPGGVAVVLAIYPKRRLFKWSVNNHKLQWWQVVGAFRQWREQRRSVVAL